MAAVGGGQYLVEVLAYKWLLWEAALTSLCQSSWMTPNTHGHTGARLHLPRPLVWIQCQATAWSLQSFYAMPS